MPEAPIWYNLLTNFGPLVVVLFIIVVGSYKASGAVWRDLVLPWRDRGLLRFDRLCDKLESTQERIAVSMETMSQRLQGGPK